MLSVTFGERLIAVNGEKWTQQCRIVAPAFHSEKLKAVIGVMAMCTMEMLDRWEKIAVHGEKPCEIELTNHMDSLTADIFIRSEFGMDYSKGKELYEDIEVLENLMIQTFRYLWLPGSRFLPTSTNIEIWKRKRRLERNLKRVIDERRESRSYGTDLLGLMLSEIDRVSTSEQNFNYSIQQVMDDCKTFFLAGRETTSLLLSWGLLLLAVNPDWQDKAREEATTVCGGTNPTSDSVGKLKIIGMILNETLRLYPPGWGIIRQAFKDLQLGDDLIVPEGVNVIVDILAVHRDPELWGPDANEFKPERFADGIAKAANHSSAFIPFSSGPRVCIGQNFALLEAKVAMAIILRRFRFAVSSSYRHAPVSFVTLNPQHGIPIIMQRISS